MIKFLNIEGLDAAGKSTQIKLLIKYLSNIQIPYNFIHFPRSGKGIFGNMIADFLQGRYGAVNEVNPYLVALIYALDRNDAKLKINKWLTGNSILIVDRYVYSNIAFQCAKVTDMVVKMKLEKWILNLEYSYNNIPKPNLSVYLHAPFDFVERKLQNNRIGKDRKYLKGCQDIHESSLDLQKQVEKEYLRLTGQNDDFVLIDCQKADGTMMDQMSIHNNLINILFNKDRNIF